MRFVYPIFILIIATVCFSTWASSLVFLSPADEAFAFVRDVQRGSLTRSVRHFGGNTCRCPKKEGWSSYLIYASGQEPNLAFLLGHKFELGRPKVQEIHKQHGYIIPWERPEDFIVDIPITFNSKEYSPFFLPLPMAYGKKMSHAEFNSFLNDPDKDAWKGFTLRLRPSLGKGAVALPKERPEEIKANSEAAKEPGLEAQARSNAKDNPDEKYGLAANLSKGTVDSLKKMLGSDAFAYLQPKEAGKVMLETREEMSLSETESSLPKLKSATLRLHVVRRGQLKNWTIYHLALTDPVLILRGNKELRVHLSALADSR